MSKSLRSIQTGTKSVSDKSKQRLSLEGQLKQARISLQRFVKPKIGNKQIKEEEAIPKWVLQRAKGLVFLTVIKAGFVFAGNVGTGCVIVRNPKNTGWSGPSSIGVAGLSFGFLAGASKVDYIMILPNDAAVKQFTGKGQLRLGGELQLAVGPVGRDTSGSVGAGDKGVSVMYSYSHAKGLYGGLALDGKVISVRPDCNKAFYRRSIKCADILNGRIDEIPFNEDYQTIVNLLNMYCSDGASVNKLPSVKKMKLDDDKQHDFIDENIIEFTPKKPHEIIPDVLIFGFIRDYMKRHKFTETLTDEIMELICNFYYFVNAVIVIDNGSGTIKAGYSGDDKPISEFSSIVGRPRNSHNANDYDSIVIGEDAKQMRGALRLKYPIQHGIVTNWEDAQRLWYHAFYNELNIRPQESYVLLSESALNSKGNREKMTQIMFETFDVKGLYIAIGEILSLYASGRTTGIVLSSGYGITDTVPIYEGYCLKHAVQRLDITGEDCTEYLIKLFSEKGHSFSVTRQRKTVESIKEKLCYIALDYDEELEKLQQESIDNDICIEYELPDGKIIEIDTERFKAPEIMFKPEIIGLSGKGVHNLIFDAIMKCDIDLRTDLFKNIIICGGNTMYNGFHKRLKYEIEKLIPQSMNCNVNVIQTKHRKYSQWIGGSILSEMSSFKNKCITKQDYDEYGAEIVHQKFP